MQSRLEVAGACQHTDQLLEVVLRMERQPEQHMYYLSCDDLHRRNFQLDVC